VERTGQFGRILKVSQRVGGLFLAGAAFAAVAWWLRRLSYEADPAIHGYLEIVGSVLALTFAANALVRFRGKYDRVALLVAHGFVVAGVLETISGLSFYSRVAGASSVPHAMPLEWMVVRTFLAALLLVALFVEHRLPQPRNPSRELLSTIAIVVAVMYLTGLFYALAAYIGAPLQVQFGVDSLVPRPWHLLPGALFFFAAVGYWQRLKETTTAFDCTLFLAAGLNALSHLMASQAVSFTDAPSAVSQLLRVSSYAIVLGGALLDNVRLFDQVRQMAASDPLTALANYRRFLDVLDVEMQRSQRTLRPFAVVFLDLDGLKKINDKHGHVVGSRALCRLAEILRSQCRSIDTAARYGGDEFAVILPETNSEAAAHLVQRIREAIAANAEEPLLSASIGVALYPKHGDTLEKLLATADRVLYAMKKRQRARARKRSSKEVAA